MTDFLEWINSLGASGPLIFLGVVVLEVLFLFPGLLFTLAAGFLFGFWRGAALILVGRTVGAALAFGIARHLLGNRARAYILKRHKLDRFMGTLGSEGWKVVLLSRMVPFFPFKLSNYAFGLMPFTLRGFVMGSFLGMIPLTLTNVYLGSIAGDLATLGERTEPRSPLEWTLYAIGFMIALGFVHYLSCVAARTLDRGTSESGFHGQVKK